MLKLNQVSFAYNIKPVLQNINFQVNKGEIVSVIGASGCGKSTLLQLIYGLHHTTGTLFWDEKQLLGPNFNIVPGEAFIKYLAQDFDLMPPLTVAENVGKHLSNMYPVKKRRRVKELLEVVEMEELAKAKAKNLSGGQMQRVALARALANEPEILLLDEPFSHIDHFSRNNLRRRLFGYLKEKKITCLIATHDSTDALSFTDKIIVLNEGKLHAIQSPENLYNNPPDKYVASLFGDVNEISLKKITPSEKSRNKILLYPQEIKYSKNSDLKATVKDSYFKGPSFLMKADLDGETIFFENKTALPYDQKISLKIDDKIIAMRRKKNKKWGT